MKNRLFVEEFEALSAEIKQKISKDGIYDRRKWKANNVLRLKVKNFEIRDVTNPSAKTWMLFNNVQEHPVCLVCGSAKVTFFDHQTGFRRFCSLKCAANSSEVKSKTKSTQLEKYPEGHHMRNKDIVTRMVSDMHEKGSYQKGKETFKKNYGCENNYQREEVKAKIKETSLKKFGCENPMQNELVKEKAALTTKDRYGSAFNPVKVKETNKERYGCENPMQNKDIAKKAKETAIERYGEVFNSIKAKETNKERYGCEYAMQNKEVSTKSAYGVKQNYIKKILPIRLAVIKEEVNTIPLFSLDSWSDANFHYRWKHETCGTTFFANLDNGKLPLCPKCKPRSIPQEMIRQILEDAKIDHLENDRVKIKPYEIDLLFENFGIEVNGVYWHNEDQPGKTLKEKTELGKLAGIKLLHFWDFEILKQTDIVKSIILDKVNLNKDVIASSLTLRTVDQNESKTFFDTNHLSRYKEAKISFALENENGIMCAASFKCIDNKDVWELVNYSCLNNFRVVGGLKRIISFFNETQNCKKLLAYADARQFNGNTFKELGFKYLGLSNPGFIYIKNSLLIRQKDARKQKVKDLLKEKFDAALSVHDNLKNAGYHRCFDCGQHRFEMDFT